MAAPGGMGVDGLIKTYGANFKSTDVAVIVAAAIGTLLVVKIVISCARFLRIQSGLSTVPAAPGAIPLLGHVITLLKCVMDKRAAWDLMEDWINSSPDKIVKFNIFGTQGVAVSHPQALKRIFQTKQKIYEKDLELSYHPFLPILGTGLVTSDGELWQKQRLLMGPALRTDVLDDIIGIAKKGVDRLSAKLTAQHKGTGKPMDIQAEFHLLTLQVIGEAVLSLGPEECDKVFPKLYIPVMEEANERVLRPYRKYLPTPSWFQFRARVAKLNKFLINLFRERRAERLKGLRKGVRPDILDRVMENIEESGTKWDAALEEQMCYEVKTFLLAGHETSAVMLTWSIYELSQSKDVVDKIRAEAQKAFGEKEEEPPRRAVDEMTYTLSVLKEVLRKYSVVPVVTRKLAQDDELMGHKVPKGSMIACILQGTHNMYEDHTAFKPERFMPGGEYENLNDSDRPYMFVPFIQGPRNCLGQHLALLEARVVLSLLAKRFTFRAAREGQGERHHSIIPIGPIDGMKVYVD